MSSDYLKQDAIKVLKDAIEELQHEFSPDEVQALKRQNTMLRQQLNEANYMVQKWAEEAMNCGSPGLTIKTEYT